jgi:hypothetical protein
MHMEMRAVMRALLTAKAESNSGVFSTAKSSTEPAYTLQLSPETVHTARNLMGQVNAEASSSRVTLDHLRAPKVAQVDADELDEGLAHMLGERVERAVGNFKVSSILPCPQSS